MKHHQGFTLVEMLVSLLLGITVIAAGLLTFRSANKTARTAQSIAQMTEDVTLAMNLLKSQIRQIGYRTKLNINMKQQGKTAILTRRNLFGCEGSFLDINARINELKCSSSKESESIAVVYELDKHPNGNSLIGSDGRPLDCLGNGVPETVDNQTGEKIHQTYHRFYLANGGLSCKGPGNPFGQNLVDGIFLMQFKYAVENHQVPGVLSEYRRASEIRDAWNRVRSVRICIVARTADEVFDAPTPYVGCDPFLPKIMPTDKRLYRAVLATVNIPNE